jgi:hypothetical protein
MASYLQLTCAQVEATYGHPHAVGFHTTGVSAKIDIHGYTGGQYDNILV